MTERPGFQACAAVEGIVDESVLRCLLEQSNEIHLTAVYGKNGRSWLKQKIRNYNEAARYGNWFVLVDLDSEAQCAPELISQWLVATAPFMFFRVAVQAIESWLLADAERFSTFFSVPQKQIPTDPEKLINPKQEMINLIRKSKRSEIREDMLPREGSGLKTGPAYSSRLIEFVNDPNKGWRVDTAAERSDSLKRCVIGIKNLRKKWKKAS